MYASVTYANIGSDNGLLPVWCQVIIWNIADLLSIGPSGINFNDILIKRRKFSLKKISLKMSSANWQWFYLSLNVLMNFCSEGVDKGIHLTHIFIFILYSRASNMTFLQTF